MEAAPPPPPQHREWVDRLRNGGSIPLSSLHHPAPNTWACPPGDVFSVRGSDYMKTKAKIAGGEWLLQPLAFDFLQGPSQITHIMNHPHSRVRAALNAAILADPLSPQQPFVWVFNLQLGPKTNYSMVYYFISFASPPHGSLMHRFLYEDDAFRNSRLKLLVRLPEAPRLVQMVVGERWPVCMLGKLVKCTYTREKHYIEVDVDLRSSAIARAAVKLTARLAAFIVSDMAFVLEGIQTDELPERILGAIRHVKLEPSSATHIDIPEEAQGDAQLTQYKPKVMKFLTLSK